MVRGIEQSKTRDSKVKTEREMKLIWGIKEERGSSVGDPFIRKASSPEKWCTHETGRQTGHESTIRQFDKFDAMGGEVFPQKGRNEDEDRSKLSTESAFCTDLLREEQLRGSSSGQFNGDMEVSLSSHVHLLCSALVQAKTRVGSA